MTTPKPQTEIPAEHASAVRWWPAAVILIIAVATGVCIWGLQDVHRQTKYLQSAGLILATTVLMLLWVLLLSRLSWHRRLLLCGGPVGLAVVLVATLEIRGVTGDLLPVFEWRWSTPTSQSLPVEQTQIEPPSVPPPVESASDYSQFSGPDRNGKLPGPRLFRDWKAQPPKLLWRQPIGAGWSGFSVVDRYAITMEQRGELEIVACYDLLSGDSVWTHADESQYESVIAGEGPRTVPTIVAGRVFTLGASGILNCLQLIDGAVIWSKDIINENESSVPGWGASCSPLVTDGKVIVSAGGGNGRSLVAYDAETGDLAWASGEDSAGYSSPVLTDIDGVAQTLIFNGPGVKSHDLNTGEILWGYDWEQGHPHIVMPVVLPGGRVLISSGYGTGSQLVQVNRDESEGWSATRIWKSNRLKSKFANMIVHGQNIYGLDDGIFVCLDLNNGELQWKRGRYGHGQIILVGETILVLAENGDLVLLEPTAEKHNELTRFRALDDKTWNPPALAGEYLLVRNNKEAACYQLPIDGP